MSGTATFAFDYLGHDPVFLAFREHLCDFQVLWVFFPYLHLLVSIFQLLFQTFQDFFADNTTNYLYLRDQMWQLNGMIPVPVHNWYDPLIKERASHGTMEIAQAMDFVDAILKDRRPLIDVYEAARSSAAAIVALKAIDTDERYTIPTFPRRS